MVTGALIATYVSNPISMSILSILSHFIIDSLPHYGQPYKDRNSLFWNIVRIDIIMIGSLIVYLFFYSNLYILAGAFFGILPDLAWVYRFSVSEKFGSLPPKPLNRINKFHSKIQTLEKKNGYFIEIIWALPVSVILFSRI